MACGSIPLFRVAYLSAVSDDSDCWLSLVDPSGIIVLQYSFICYLGVVPLVAGLRLSVPENIYQKMFLCKYMICILFVVHCLKVVT